jgi:hypothetical protein
MSFETVALLVMPPGVDAVFGMTSKAARELGAEMMASAKPQRGWKQVDVLYAKAIVIEHTKVIPRPHAPGGIRMNGRNQFLGGHGGFLL